MRSSEVQPLSTPQTALRSLPRPAALLPSPCQEAGRPGGQHGRAKELELPKPSG